MAELSMSIERYQEQSQYHEKDQFQTKINFVCNHNKLQPAKDTDTPRSSMSESSQNEPEKSILKEEPPVAIQEKTMRTGISDITVTKWADYTHKYGIAYMLSNGCYGVLFNDETKIIHNPKYDKMHYFNAQDVLINSYDNYSEKGLQDYPSDLKKKAKILNYMK